MAGNKTPRRQDSGAGRVQRAVTHDSAREKTSKKGTGGTKTPKMKLVRVNDTILKWIRRSNFRALQSSEKRLVRGLVKFLPVLP